MQGGCLGLRNCRVVFPLSAVVQLEFDKRERVWVRQTVGFAQIIALLSFDSLPRLVKGPRYFCLPLLVGRQSMVRAFLQFPTGVSKLKEGERIWQTCSRASIPSSIFFFVPSYAQRWAPPRFAPKTEKQTWNENVSRSIDVVDKCEFEVC